ncbi:hypothetical protein J2T12_000412 [Paenibacillus anaericanus]|uniref:YheC/YheD family endospore coat-associated protein n=1 Tax=Paenibacillus anaericanus TaxID=170367 RepID=UPI00277FCF2E|nr:YheC/YheD family protein [Paenibacillus anaericanus]MDQ0087018.1 hypothetical protein [Paenibacillus anaericanus]
MSHPLDDRKPVLAVLTVEDEWKQFKGNRANFRDIMKTGRDLNFPVYVVTTKDLKLSASRIQGYLFSPEEKAWHKEWCPLPDVIYNRIPLREDERKKAALQKIDECLHHSSIHIYNPFFFNKWRLFDWLKKGHSTKALVPDTKRMLASKSLSAMLRTYQSLYLKPESGKAGKGIMLLQFDASSPMPYRLTIQGQRKKNIVYKTAVLSSLWKRIRKETGKTPYIMQEGISLATFRNRHFDLRVLVQKTGKGVWMVTGVGARLAGLKRITTHVPQGGSVEDPEKLLIPVFGQEMTTILLNRLKSNSLLIAKQLEKGAGYNLGEMSMDLGIDTNGKMWFFEANAKPMKFDEPHIRKKSLERIFHYSHYLSQQSKD